MGLNSIFSFNLVLLIEAFALRFSIFDPLGTVPLIPSLTGAYAEERAMIVRQSVLVPTVILSVFAYLGFLIFQVLGITLNDFRIAGGIVLFLVAIDNLRGRKSSTRSWGREKLQAFPLAIPLLAGPGAISTAIIFANPPFGPFMVLVVILLNSAVAGSRLNRGPTVQRILEVNGTSLFTRIMGLLMAAIGVRFIGEGIVAKAKSITG
jgi:multiple antibiotic resistance protein